MRGGSSQPSERKPEMKRFTTSSADPLTAMHDLRSIAVLGLAVLVSACATPPAVPFSVDVPAGVGDGRARFTEIYCSVLQERGDELPDYRPCAEALSNVASQPRGTGKPVDLGPSRLALQAMIVPGLGYACIAPWLQPPATPREHVARFGYEAQMVAVDALSGTTKNAHQIRDAIMALPRESGPPRVVLVGYSKGAPDALEALVRYPDGGTLLGFLNADHWAVVMPVDRSHRVLGSTLVNHNDYPREALLEALLRYVEEDLAAE
jgi:hypothetical protein